MPGGLTGSAYIGSRRRCTARHRVRARILSDDRLKPGHKAIDPAIAAPAEQPAPTHPASGPDVTTKGAYACCSCLLGPRCSSSTTAHWTRSLRELHLAFTGGRHLLSALLLRDWRDHLAITHMIAFELSHARCSFAVRPAECGRNEEAFASQLSPRGATRRPRNAPLATCTLPLPRPDLAIPSAQARRLICKGAAGPRLTRTRSLRPVRAY